MTIRDLITRNRAKRFLPVSRREEEHPVFSLQREMNQLFDSFFRGFDLSPFGDMDEWEGEFYPKIDVKESNEQIEIMAELPGLDEKDIEVSLTGDALILKGQKKEEKEEKKKNYWRTERHYGSFHRVIPMPEEIDTEKVGAIFKKGVLHITVPKTAKVESVGKKIHIALEK
jgi:HSP20 family protein